MDEGSAPRTRPLTEGNGWAMLQDMFSDFSSKKQVRGLLDAISRFKYQLPKE